MAGYPPARFVVLRYLRGRDYRTYSRLPSMQSDHGSVHRHYA
nr:MAG TPA: hypothetical protein [Caudoviricetes sp.]